MFGPKFSDVHPAPLLGDSFFFSNRQDLKSTVEAKGWRFNYVSLPLVENYAESSLQSKYVKFLQFLKLSELDLRKEYDHIVYFDHKFKVNKEHIDRLFTLKKNKIMIRETLGKKETVWDEVKSGMKQKRYAKSMDATIEYVKKGIESGLSEKFRVCNTGLILYDVRETNVISLADDIYNDLVTIGTAECQIVWCMVAQRYSDIIQTISWTSIPIEWKAPPETLRLKIKRHLLKTILKVKKALRLS